MEALVGIMLGVVALLALGALAAALWFVRIHSRETARLIAQADERVLAAWTQGDRAVSRLISAKHPASHQLYRQQSGTIDGAQHANKLHLAELDESPAPNQEAAVLREQLDQLRVQRDAVAADVHGRRNVPVATQLSFEDELPMNGGSR